MELDVKVLRFLRSASKQKKEAKRRIIFACLRETNEQIILPHYFASNSCFHFKDMQYKYAAVICSMEMQRGQTSRPCSMAIREAVWTSRIIIQHGHAAWVSGMDIQRGHEA